MSASNNDEDAERTTPVGLFHYAESYWLSARALEAQRVKCTHPDEPVNFLFYHAVELLLKAYLRHHGMTPKVMASRPFSHNVGALARRAEELGLWLMDEDRDVVSYMEQSDAVIRSRYIKTGAFQRPTHGALDRTCKSLHETVGQVLRDAGHPIRKSAAN